MVPDFATWFSFQGPWLPNLSSKAHGSRFQLYGLANMDFSFRTRAYSSWFLFQYTLFLVSVSGYIWFLVSVRLHGSKLPFPGHMVPDFRSRIISAWFPFQDTWSLASVPGYMVPVFRSRIHGSWLPFQETWFLASVS